MTASQRGDVPYEAFFDASPDALIAVDRAGKILLANRQVEALFGHSPTELAGRPVETLIPTRYRRRHAELREGFMQDPKTRPMGQKQELWALRKDGREFPVEVSLSPIQTPGPAIVLAAVRDVTRSRRAERQFRDLIEGAPDAMILVEPTGTMALVNKQAETLFGYGRADLLGQQMGMLVPESLRRQQEDDLAVFFANPTTRPMRQCIELLGLHRDGTQFPVEISLSPLETDEGLSVMASVRDITERKRESESLQRLAAVVQASMDSIVMMDLDGIITTWNEACHRMFGYTAQEAIGKSIQLILPPGTEEEVAAAMARLRRGEPVGIDEVERVCKDGSIVWVSLTASPAHDPAGRVVGATAIMRDITQQRRIQEQVKESLREKEILLVEVHHRVKNNLQVVASLLNLQGQFAGDARSRELFEDSRNRVRSIALVHEKLYRSEDLARLDFGHYIEALVHELQRFYRKEGIAKIAVEAQPMTLAMDPAINCGLILSELVSNCLKHAFPAGRSGTIRITVKPVGQDRISIAVGDDGVGLKQPFDLGSTRTMGMQLVGTLVKQMEGTIELLPGPGTTFLLNLRIRPGEAPSG